MTLILIMNSLAGFAQEGPAAESSYELCQRLHEENSQHPESINSCDWASTLDLIDHYRKGYERCLTNDRVTDKLKCNYSNILAALEVAPQEFNQCMDLEQITNKQVCNSIDNLNLFRQSWIEFVDNICGPEILSVHLGLFDDSDCYSPWSNPALLREYRNSRYLVDFLRRHYLIY